VLVGNKSCPIIGKISMDYTTINLDSCPQAKVGQEVLLVGKIGGNSQSIEDWARIKQTHPYDIICALGKRLDRVYNN